MTISALPVPDLRNRLARAAAFCDLQSHGATDAGVRAEWLAHGQTCRDAAAAVVEAHQRCGKCGHRWDGAVVGVLCGDCWRAALASPLCACGTTMVCPDIGCDLHKVPTTVNAGATPVSEGATESAPNRSSSTTANGKD